MGVTAPGKVFPVDAPRATSSEAEKSVWKALKASLPAGWTAWHSLRVRTRSGAEGEGDFVLASPERGLVVLEVKGGQLELKGGHWLQNGNRMDKAPRDQAQGYVRKLVEEMRRRGAEPPAYSVASVFPDCDFSAGPDSGGLEGLVLGRRDLPYLEEALNGLKLNAANRAVAGQKWVQTLHSMWGETWVPVVRLADRVADAEVARVALDEVQLSTLDEIADNERVLISGEAGTGKTLLATELARRHATAGKRVLMLCFTDGLALSVDRHFGEELGAARQLHVYAIRQYARGLLQAAEQGTTATGDAFWKEVSLQAACAALPGPELRPDLIVIDEAQDFDETDWLLVEQLAAERKLWVFSGVGQSYWKERQLPEFLAKGAFKLKLKKAYRSPPAILDFAHRYVDGADQAAPYKGDPRVLRLSVAKDGALLEQLRVEVEALIQQGAKPHDIAIVTLAGQRSSALFGNTTLGRHKIVHIDSPEVGRHVVADTFLRFKGLERPFIIVTELSMKNMVHYDTRMHIALTRATVGAVVVAEATSIGADPRLQLLPRDQER